MKKYITLIILLLGFICIFLFVLLKNTKNEINGGTGNELKKEDEIESGVNNDFVILTQDDLTIAQQTLINEAYAFYYRGKSLNYDDNNITYLSGFVPSSINLDDPNYNQNVNHKIWKRRSSYFYQPEDATPQNIQYFVCSEFVLNTYRNAFVDQNNNGFMLYYNDGSLGENGTDQISSSTVVWGTFRYMNIANNGQNSMHYLTRYYYNVEEKLNKLKNGNGNGQGCNGDECYIKLQSEMQSEIKTALLNIDYAPGDIIVYRSRKKCNKIVGCGKSTGGHIMLYVGKSSPNGMMPNNKKDRYLLHSVGSSYKYDSKYDSHINEPNGTVQQITLDEAINNVLKSGVATSSVSTEIAVLSPLKEILNSHSYGVSSNAIARANMPELVRTKIASVGTHESVNPGDQITYTITLENKSSNSYTGINISDEVPTNTEYVSCTSKCIKNRNAIKWQDITLIAGEIKNYSYTVKVNSDTHLASEIVNDKTVVAGIKMNTITTTVNKTLTKELQKKLVNRVKTTLKDKEYTSNSSFEFIEDAYDGIVNIDFGKNMVYVENLFKKFYNITNNNIYVLKSSFEDDNFTTMYVKGLFGGYYTTSEGQYKLEINNGVLHGQQPILFDGRELTYDDDTLMIGDVLLIYDSNYSKENYAYREYGAYLFLGYNTSDNVVEFATIDDNRNVKIVSGKLGETNRSRLLESLPGQNAFIVLRPSYGIK